MAKKDRLEPRPQDPVHETHMEVWRRLAAVKHMHGTPGDRKPKR
jgi:hypothetical protein